MAYLYLSLAIAAEVGGTLALKATRGFTSLVPSIAVICGYSLAFFLLSLALRTMSVGTAYAIWSGVGTAVVALAGAIIFHERLTPTMIVGIALIVVGVVVLEIGTEASTDAAP